MMVWLQTQGYGVDRGSVRRLMRLMGLETIYPKPRLSQPGEPGVRYPYLLRGVSIDRVNQVWSCDITSIREALSSDGDYRLVQPVRADLGTFNDDGYQLLFGSA